MSPLLGKFRNLHPGVGIEAVIGVGGICYIAEFLLWIKGLYLINIKSSFFHNGGYSSIRKIVIQWGQVRVGIAI